MLKNNGKIAIQKNFLLCLCVICLIFTSFGLAVENSYAVDLNETSDTVGTQLDSEIQLNSQENEMLEGDNSNNDMLTAEPAKPFDDIKKAISKAHDGDTIYLSGLYLPKDKHSVITVDKSINIVGTQGTIIDGNGVSSVFMVTSSYVAIKNIKFINAVGEKGSCIFALAKNVLCQLAEVVAIGWKKSANNLAFKQNLIVLILALGLNFLQMCFLI